MARARQPAGDGAEVSALADALHREYGLDLRTPEHLRWLAARLKQARDHAPVPEVAARRATWCAGFETVSPSGLVALQARALLAEAFAEELRLYRGFLRQFGKDYEHSRLFAPLESYDRLCGHPALEDDGGE